MPAMGPLPQKIGFVIHLGHAGHKGGESLQAGKEKLLAGQRKAAGAGSARGRRGRSCSGHSCSETQSPRQQGQQALTRDWGAAPTPRRHLPNVNRYLGPLEVAMAGGEEPETEI